MTGGGETCLHPDSSSETVDLKFYPKVERDKRRKAKWFSQIKGGFKIKYSSELQLEFLRLLHVKARQTFSYLCANSAAWYSAERGSHAHAIALLGDNEYEYKTGRLGPSVILNDGCSVQSSNSSTVFSLDTARLSRLPITDFKPVDFGKPGQQFGFKVGPVCFSS
jgi:collagen type V/XI/XXIV/XXVII alpha